MSQVPLTSGMILGGVLISALGAGSTVYIEEKKPSVKSLSRDFIIGAIMVAMIIQLLPESSTTVIEYLLKIVPLSLFTAGAAGSIGEGGATLSAFTQIGGNSENMGASTDDIEVKVGVPRF